MSRNFGLTGGIASGAQPQPRPRTSADTTRANSNILQFSQVDRVNSLRRQPNLDRSTAGPFFIPDSADQDMAAFWFALAFFTAPGVAIGTLISGWLLFF